MEVEKRSSKGGFFQLFDWNSKSRKKLFSNKSELPESSKHNNSNVNISATSRHHQITVHENGFYPSTRGSDHSCSSSLSNEESSTAKHPGVVARLMGLDSLPTSNIQEQVFNPHSFRVYQNDFSNDRQMIDYSSARGKLDGFTKNPVEHRLHKFSNSPIERFQTEVLPPKSAKAISITHHKLLSPIKSPGFILTKNAAYVMEAASRIIDQSPQSKSIKNGHFPSVNSSSVPLRIRDLKERMEASRPRPAILQKPKESICVKITKGSQIGSESSKQIKVLKKKERLGPPANQAKNNVQQNEEPSRKLRENQEVKLQRVTQKNLQKKTPPSKNCDVLRQNNLKQNANRERESKAKKPVLSEDKTSAKEKMVTRARKSNAVNDKNISQKKKPVKDKINEIPKGKNEKSVICNFSSDGCANWDAAVDVKNGMDVVSFTFTSPIKKSTSGSHSSDNYDDHIYSKSSSNMEMNLINSDALSLLLEQKLKELSSKVESNPVEENIQVQLSRNQDLQRSKETSGSSNSENSNEFNCQYSSPNPTMEPSFTDASCNSSVTKNIVLFYNKKGWESEYIRDIIISSGSISNNYLIQPFVFDHLESQTSEEHSKLDRKLLFDCVSECIEFRRQRFLNGGFRSWIKWTSFAGKRERVVEELYKEISDFKSMGELMVDELVEKDMSNQYGKWVEFEVEEFEEGFEIQDEILNSLIDEFVVDLFLL